MSMSHTRVQDLYTGRVASLPVAGPHASDLRSQIANALSIDLARDNVRIYTDRRRFLTESSSALEDNETLYVIRNMSGLQAAPPAAKSLLKVGENVYRNSDVRADREDGERQDPVVASVKPIAEERALRFAQGINDRDQHLVMNRKDAPIAFGQS